jgi:hypothetical protein
MKIMANHSSATAREHTPHTIKSVTEKSDTSTSDIDEDDSTKPTIEALVEMICGGGDDVGTRSAALLVLMGTLQDAEDPRAVANAAKHFAFTQCGEFNAFGVVDDQIALLGRELLISHSRLC